MNMNDPFGRVQSKRQKDYESLRDSLIKNGVTTRVQAEELLVKLRRRGNWWLAVIVPGTLLLALVLTEMRGFVLVCGAIALLWLINTLKNSQEHVKRYIQEEFGEH